MQDPPVQMPEPSTIEYARPSRGGTAGALTVFWTIFWTLGASLAVGTVFARDFIRQSVSQWALLSAMFWVAAFVLVLTRHRLRFRMATVWMLSLWLPALYWLIWGLMESGLAILFFGPFMTALLGALTVGLAISLRLQLWRAEPGEP